MSEFEDVVSDLKAEHEKKGRVALVLMFDKLPGTTMFDIQELGKETYMLNHANPSYINLTVAVAVDEQAQAVEDLIKTQLNNE